jgi:demethylmenaquinone methyltransferase/2-methoxy-6-polyprenyl-1,4-benzoquinol methylase
MFTSIARRYDLLNHVLSLNADRLWRKSLVRRAHVDRSSRVLDVATGTGDVAVAFAAAGVERITGLDRSEGMLAVGREKVERRGLGTRVRLIEGDALDMPFADGSFDVSTMAFGLRNLPDYAGGISEMARVVRSGGRVLVLEFFPPRSSLFHSLYRFYLGRILPIVGRIISGSDEAYRYLASSIETFIAHEDMMRYMNEAGLIEIDKKMLTGGIAYIYSGTKS